MILYIINKFLHRCYLSFLEDRVLVRVFGQNRITPTLFSYLYKTVFKIPDKSLVQIPADKDDHRIPVILLLAGLVITEMLCETIQNIFCLTNINGICSVIFQTDQEINANTLDIVPVTRGNLSPGDLDRFPFQLDSSAVMRLSAVPFTRNSSILTLQSHPELVQRHSTMLAIRRWSAKHTSILRDD